MGLVSVRMKVEVRGLGLGSVGEHQPHGGAHEELALAHLVLEARQVNRYS